MCALSATPALHKRLLLEDAMEGGRPSEPSDSHQHFSITLMFWNRVLLVLMLLLLWPFWEAFLDFTWLLLIMMVLYIWFIDMALPLTLVSVNPAFWVERLLPLYAPVHRMLLPLLAPLMTPREKNTQDIECANEGGELPSEEAMEAFLEEGEAEGILEEGDSELIRNLVKLSDTVVREVMTPRNRILAIASSAPLEEIWETFRSSRKSRLPVYENTPDNIRGILLLKDLIQMQGQDKPDWTSLVKAPLFVPESKPTLELLRELQLAKTQIAIVVDEYGALAGLTTVEDLLEEVVGEIHEEHESSSILHESSPGVYSVPGETHVDDLASALDIELEHEGFDTVAGLVMWKLGRIPNPLETIRLEHLSLRVMKMEGQRIILVEVRLDS